MRRKLFTCFVTFPSAPIRYNSENHGTSSDNLFWTRQPAKRALAKCLHGSMGVNRKIDREAKSDSLHVGPLVHTRDGSHFDAPATDDSRLRWFPARAL